MGFDSLCVRSLRDQVVAPERQQPRCSIFSLIAPQPPSEGQCRHDHCLILQVTKTIHQRGERSVCGSAMSLRQSWTGSQSAGCSQSYLPARDTFRPNQLPLTHPLEKNFQGWAMEDLEGRKSLSPSGMASF